MKIHFTLLTLIVFINCVQSAMGREFLLEQSQIPNIHFVGTEKNILRGHAPLNQLSELRELGVTDVLIFKNDLKGEVREEIKKLNKLGIHARNIPFKWKEVTDPVLACTQMIQALKILNEVKHSSKRKIFFHCTVGEDRTGLLAGIWNLFQKGRISDKKIFQKEMCDRGYAEGNEQKPQNVVYEVHQNLTPMFNYFAEQAKQGLNLSSLHESLCDNYAPEENDRRLNCK